jgi:uncharacterized membrane protein
MDIVFRKHIKRLHFYVFAIGIIVALFYVGSILDADVPGRTLAALIMLPFYVGCAALLSFVVWIITRFLG